MRLRGLLCVVVLVVLTSVSLACAYMIDRNRQTRSIEGSVISVDWVASKLVVRIPLGGNVDEMTFTVAEDAQITRVGEIISLADILQNDPVTVTYYNASPGPLIAVSVTDSNQANM